MPTVIKPCMGVALANLAEIAYMNQIHEDMYVDKKKH